jgi:hypothetical protein
MMKYIEKIEVLLPLGYLYLIIVGILKESLFFYQLGINILKYTNIMDVLISPIATMFSHPIIFIAILSFFTFCFYLPSILIKKGHIKWVQKVFELKKTSADLPESELKNYYMTIAIRFLAVGLLSIYLGYGSAEGYLTAKRIKNFDLKYHHKLNFNTGESEEVCLLETNSLYCFYVTKNESNIKIAPLNTVKYIEINKNKTPKRL